jgi:hypothetical protein
MWDMSIRQLARLTGGALTLSETPPLGGMLEPIGRVVHVQDNYAPGDVVFVESEDTKCLESLYLQGAMGVVATRRCGPLAGGFGVCVADVRSALRCMAEYARDRYSGKLIIKVVPNEYADDVSWRLVGIDQAAPVTTIKLSVARLFDLRWCDADEVLIDGRLSKNQRDFVVTYLPTNAPIRLAG